jgi:hypothetical protein
MRIVLVLLPYWAAGFFLSHVFMIKIGDRCPCPKCWWGSLVGLAYGACYYFFLGFKAGYGIAEHILSVILAALIAAALALAICPMQMKMK